MSKNLKTKLEAIAARREAEDKRHRYGGKVSSVMRQVLGREVEFDVKAIIANERKLPFHNALYSKIRIGKYDACDELLKLSNKSDKYCYISFDDYSFMGVAVISFEELILLPEISEILSDSIYVKLPNISKIIFLDYYEDSLLDKNELYSIYLFDESQWFF